MNEMFKSAIYNLIHIVTTRDLIVLDKKLVINF